jgi:hypothetical protein
MRDKIYGKPLTVKRESEREEISAAALVKALLLTETI